jgi:hypothetical protein
MRVTVCNALKRVDYLFLVFAVAILAIPCAAQAQGRYYEIADAGGFSGADDDGIVGFIYFGTGGLITDPADVLGFEYTNENGTSYDLSDIVSIRVLVDDIDGELCWRAADGQTPNDCEEFDAYEIQSGEKGLVLNDSSTGGYAFSVDSTAPVNFASAFPTDTSELDRFVSFVRTSPPDDSDLDGDGLSLADEEAFGTDPEVSDTDGDTIPDGSDPDIVIAAIDLLPDGSFANSADPDGQRNAMNMRLVGIQADIASGDIEEALRKLRNLRERVDGCETTAGDSPQGDDWIPNCANQLEIRRLIDLLISNLEASVA